MKRTLIIVLLLCLGIIGFANPEGKTKINIILKEQSNTSELMRTASVFPNKAACRDFVVNTLRRQAEESQYGLLSLLHEFEANGLVEEIRPLWIVNSVSCYADEAVIHAIESRNDIMTVYAVKQMPLQEESEALPMERSDGREIAEHLLQVNANQVWELGYTGEDVLIAIIDTGVSLTHADLQGRYWDGGDDYPNHGYDFANHDNDPSDQNGHGTHVAGIICGTGASGTQTGVAPDAKIMILKVFGNNQQTDETILVEAMQFAIEHGADLLNMSLGWPDPDSGIKRLYRQACENTLAAGIVAAVCAGNIRDLQYLVPIPHNIYSPGDCPPPYLHEDQMVNAGGVSCVISVGAVDFNDEITYFSSVGPSAWTDVPQYNDYPYDPNSSTEIGLIRPDVCAPGLNINSLDFHSNSGYTLMDGTSMATPCVAGTIALMLSKNHELTPAEIDEILERTAVHLSEHKSNDFGSGRIDALAAINAVGYETVIENTLKAVVYPNPSTGDFTVQCEGMKRIEVFSMDGRLIKSIQTESPVHQLHGLKNGTFLIKITTTDGVIMKKIVKL
jgi:subtilisin family serine protease